MTYVVQRVEEGLRRICHSGRNPKYDAQICTYFVRSAETKGEANQNKSTAISRVVKEGYDEPTRGNENTAGLDQVTKTEQAKPAQTGRRNHHEFSA